MGIICRPVPVFRPFPSNILPAWNQHCSNSHRWLARNLGDHNWCRDPAVPPFRGAWPASCSLETQSRQGTVPSGTGTIIVPFPSGVKIPCTPFLPQEIHTCNARMCISHRRALWGSVCKRLRRKDTLHRKDIMRKKPGPCEPSFLVPIVTTRLSIPNRGRNPRRHEYLKIGQRAMYTQAITVPHRHQDPVGTSAPLFKPFWLS